MERGEECKGRRTMECCVSHCMAGGAHLHLLSLVVDTFLIGLLRRSLPALLQTCGIPRRGKSSSGSSPHIKMTKQRPPPPPKGEKNYQDEVK